MDQSTACRILRTLLDHYAASPSRQLSFEDPFQLVIVTILSAQTTDRAVESVQDELFRKYPTPIDLAHASEIDVDRIIHRVGFHRAKARNIIAAARMIEHEFGGTVPRTMEDLVLLPGVGRKTANIVLSRAFDINVGIAVDTHVKRLSQRIGFSDHTTPEKIEQDLIALFPKEAWKRINFTLMQHGRAVCTSQRPKHGQCIIRDDCRYYQRLHNQSELREEHGVDE
jgi:endonuclease III